MKVMGKGITEILRRSWLFSTNKIKSSESGSKQPTQLIIVAHNYHTYSSQNHNFNIRLKKCKKSNASWPEIPKGQLISE